MTLRVWLRWAFTVISAPFVYIFIMNVEKLAEQKGWNGFLPRLWEAYFPMLYEQLTQPWVGLLATAIVSFTAGLWLDWFFRFREREFLLNNSGVAAKSLAEEADNLSGDLFKCLAVFQRLPPTHPMFGMENPNPGQWMMFNHDQRGRALQHYLSQHAADCWRVIEGARHFVTIDRGETARVELISSDSDIDEMARFLASLSARLRLFSSGELPLPIKSTAPVQSAIVRTIRKGYRAVAMSKDNIAKRFNHLLDAMVRGERPSGKRKAKGGTSRKDASEGYAETQPPSDPSEDASLKPKRGSR